MDNNIDFDTLSIQNSESESYYKNKYTYLLADYQNLQKRKDKEISDAVNKMRYKTLNEFIGIYNDINFASRFNEEGVVLLHKKFKKLLIDNNIGIIDRNYISSNYNNIFSENYATAISAVETYNPKLNNTIHSVVEDGFYDKSNNNYVFKYAKVIIFKLKK